MKVKTMKKRLVLSKETVACLDSVALGNAKGGVLTIGCETMAPQKSCPPICLTTDAVSNCSCVTC